MGDGEEFGATVLGICLLLPEQSSPEITGRFVERKKDDDPIKWIYILASK